MESNGSLGSIFMYQPPSSAAGPKTYILKGLEYRVKVEKTEEVNTKVEIPKVLIFLITIA